MRSETPRSPISQRPGLPSDGSRIAAPRTIVTSSAIGHRLKYSEIFCTGVGERTRNLRHTKRPARIEMCRGKRLRVPPSSASSIARFRSGATGASSATGSRAGFARRDPRSSSPCPRSRPGSSPSRSVATRPSSLAITISRSRSTPVGRWIGGVRRAVERPRARRLLDVGLVLISHRSRSHALPTLRRMPRSATVVVRGRGGLLSRSASRAARAPGGRRPLHARRQITARHVHETASSRAASVVVRGEALPSICAVTVVLSGFGDIGSGSRRHRGAADRGSCRPRSGRANVTARRAVRVEDLRARMLVPIHHGRSRCRTRARQPARWLVELAKTRGVRDHVHVMAAGQSERFQTHDRDKP